MLISASIIAQNSRYFDAIYTIHYNTDVPQTRTGTLQIDIENKHSIFHISKDQTEETATEDIQVTETGMVYTYSYKDIESFIGLKLNENRIYAKESHHGEIYYIDDKVPKIEWNIQYTDRKKTGSLTCKKATTHFRGRSYIAWYTEDIPLNYGPYKFHGLPGLITRIEDDTSRYVWTLTSYKKKNEKPVFTYKKNRQPVLSEKEFYSDIQYFIDPDRMRRVQSKLPKGITLISVTSNEHIRTGIEIAFEWEKEKQ